jgi:DNA-binding SARP family transcriptional activator
MQFGILGPLEARDAGGRRIDVGAPRQRAVLAVLLLHLGEVVSIDRLIDQLWGETPPPAATASLQAYVSNLRRVLEPDRRPRQAAAILVTEAPGYVLRVPADALDAVRFERLAAEGRDALSTGDASRAITLLDAALTLWRGDALAEFAYEPFATADVARLNELRVGAEEDRIEARVVIGDHVAAIAAVERLVAIHPLREQLRALQIRLLYRCGRQADALHAFDEARRMLVEQLGVSPSRDLEALHRQVLDQDPLLDAPAVAPRLRAAAWTTTPKPRRQANFVGRDDALVKLDEALDDAVAGRPRIVLVEGESGIGKTRLAAEFSARATGVGHAVVWGRCHEDEGAPALWPWVQVLRSLDAARHDEPPHIRAVLAALLPELGPMTGDAVDGEAARFRLFDAVREVVERRAREQAIVIVLDDIHTGDVSSLLLLRFLAVELRDCRVVIVGTFRPPDDRINEGLAATLGELAGRPGVERLPLIGLSCRHVAELVGATTSVAEVDIDSVAEAVHRRTNGNPFFVTELIRLMESEGRLDAAAAATDVPVAVSEVVRRRVGRLPDDARAVLGVASVIGRHFDVDVLAVACGLDVDRTLDALEAALATRILVETELGAYAFAHALVTETLYDDLNPVRRVRLHGRVAAAIEATYVADLAPHYNELARHYGRAPTADVERAVAFARLAAEQASARLAYDEAVEHWREVVSAYERSGTASPDAHARTLVELATALRRAGHLAVAVATLDNALDVAGRSSDALLVADVALAYGEVGLWQVRRYGTVDERVISVISQALERVDTADSSRRARLLSGLAIAVYYCESERERGLVLTREAIEIARRIGDRRLLAANLVELLVMLDAVPDSAEQLSAANELGVIDPAELDRETASAAATRLVRVALAAGDASGLDEAIASVARVAARRRQPDEQLWAAWPSATVAFLRGRLDDAEQLAGEAFVLHERLGIWGGPETYALHMVFVWREQGRLGEVAPVVEPLLAEAVHPGAAKLRALFAIERGAPGEIPLILGPDPIPRLKDFTWLSELCVTAEAAAAAHLPCAGELYEVLLPFAPRVVTMDGTFVCLGSASRYLGLLAEALGRDDRAIAHLQQAVTVNDRIGAVPWSTRSRIELSRVVAPEDRSYADALARRARADADAHGLVALRAQLDGLYAASS